METRFRLLWRRIMTINYSPVIYVQIWLKYHHLCWTHTRQMSYYVITNLINNKAWKKEKRKLYLDSIIKLPGLIILLSKSVWSILLLYQDMIHKFIRSFKTKLYNCSVSDSLLGIRVFIYFHLTNIFWVPIIC